MSCQWRNRTRTGDCTVLATLSRADVVSNLARFHGAARSYAPQAYLLLRKRANLKTVLATLNLCFTAAALSHRLRAKGRP